MTFGFNFNSFNFDPLELLKKNLKLKIILAGGGCLLGVVMFAVITWAMLGPISVVENAATTVADTASDAAEGIGSFFQKTWNMITLGHFTETENAWYAELNDQYEDYSEDGIYIDRALIASALFFDQPMEFDHDYKTEMTEEDLNKYESKEDLEKALEEGTDVQSSPKLDYSLLVWEAKDLAKAFAKGKDGQAKTEEEIRKYLEEEYMPYKYLSLGRTIPNDEDAKKKEFKEAVDFIYLKRDVYADLFEKDGQCEFTQNPDSGTRQLARTTIYGSEKHGYSLMGSLDVQKYMKTGEIYINSEGYYMWKGGSIYNKKTYGEKGTDYLIVAGAAPGDEGVYSKTCGITFERFDDVRWFDYGDTFTLELTTDHGKTYKAYNSIILDECGACIVWSPTHKNKCNPKPELAKKTNGTRLDVYVKESSPDYKRPADYGYFTEGTSSGLCIGTIDLGALTLGHSGLNVVNKPIEQLISKQGVQEINNQIKANVEKYGKGTGNGVAAAAITLINGLKSKGYYLPYRYGGGHDSGDPALGVDLDWGHKTSPDGNGRSIDTYDCSAFVSWAMYNGGCPHRIYYTGNISSDKSIKIKSKISDAQPGDIFNYHTSNGQGHVMLVVQNNGGKVTLAESSTSGIVFSDASKRVDSKYKLYDMSTFYKKHCQQ